MALNKEVWLQQIMEGFYPDNSFLKKSIDCSQFVENHKLHIPSAGIDPNVLVNNSTYPIKVVERADEDCEITLDRFETENTMVRHIDTIEYSYDKLESVIRQHRDTLKTKTAEKAIHAYAPSEDSVYTPVISTTGTTTGTRKRLQFVDILTLKERFDDALIPLEERYLVLHPKHVTDLLLEDLELFKDLTNLKAGEPFNFAGFGMFAFPYMPTYLDGEKESFGTSEGQFASIAFSAKEVMRADGDVYMFSKIDDPEQRATVVGFEKRFVALPVRNMGIGAIISTAVSAS